jgi:DNA-binding winged helix-turn-helix (wHTH) protein
MDGGVGEGAARYARTPEVEMLSPARHERRAHMSLLRRSPSSFDLLLALVHTSPRLVTFDALIEVVWPGVVVSPETLTQRVKLLRQALGDSADNPHYIIAVRGHGYRMAIPAMPLSELQPPSRSFTVNDERANFRSPRRVGPSRCSLSRTSRVNHPKSI